MEKGKRKKDKGKRKKGKRKAWAYGRKECMEEMDGRNVWKKWKEWKETMNGTRK